MHCDYVGDALVCRKNTLKYLVVVEYYGGKKFTLKWFRDKWFFILFLQLF